MSASEDFSKPAWGNAIDSDLDQMRANVNFLTMIAAHGSLVMPGWKTTAVSNSDPKDYGEPDSIVLTRGSRAIYFNYTWTDSAVSSIIMCYDDGVSSPGKVCFDAIEITYDSDGNIIAFGSEFDKAVEALAPDLYYGYQDTSFATDIDDLSGNGYHMTQYNAVTAPITTAMRTTRKQAMEVTGHASSGWSTNAVCYTTSLGAVSTFVHGAQELCYQFSFRSSNTTGATAQWLVGALVHENITALAAADWANTSDYMRAIARYTVGSYTDSSSTTMNDGASHIVTVFYSVAQNLRRIYIDGVQAFTGTYAATIDNWAVGWIIGARQGASSKTETWDTDHTALWSGTIPTIAEIQDMHTKYLAEI